MLQDGFFNIVVVLLGHNVPKWIVLSVLLHSQAQYLVQTSFSPHFRTKSLFYLKKIMSKIKDTQNWLQIMEKTLHSILRNMIGQLSMFLVFRFRPLFGRVFFFDIFLNFFRISNRGYLFWHNSVISFPNLMSKSFLRSYGIVLSMYNS